MADYVLTQTGQEVQDILDSMGATYFFSQVCSTWASDSTYTDYPYKGTITLEGVDGTMGVEVTFSNADATSGNFSPICNTTNDAVEIWSKTNTSVTIPTIKITKNGYVNLNGDSNYMPQSGGNFTGAVTIEGDPVVTKSDVGITEASGQYTTASWATGTNTCTWASPSSGTYVVIFNFSLVDANATNRNAYKQLTVRGTAGIYNYRGFYKASGTADSAVQWSFPVFAVCTSAGQTLYPYVHTDIANMVFDVKIWALRIA